MHSPHFTESELACAHCGVNRVRQETLDMLEAFRAAIKAPVYIDDAYRCATHNQAVGGAKDSQHVLGRAADIKIYSTIKTKSNMPVTVDVLEAVADTLTADGTVTGIGRDDHKGYIHIDCRRVPGTGQIPRDSTGAVIVARWCYNEAGQPVDYYPVPLATPVVKVPVPASRAGRQMSATAPNVAGTPANVAPVLKPSPAAPLPALMDVTGPSSGAPSPSQSTGEFTSHTITGLDPATGTATVTPPLKSTMLDRIKGAFTDHA